MALFESLERLPGIEVRRDMTTQNRLPDGRGTVYLHLAARSYDWSRVEESLFSEIEAFAIRGGRLVIAFYPEPVAPHRYFLDPQSPESAKNDSQQNEGKKSTGDKKQSPGKKESKAELWETLRTQSLKERWSIALAHVPLQTGADDIYEAELAENVSQLPLPETIAWHSGLVLTNASSAWRTIYARGRNPVVMERRWGAGSVVLSTDCFFLSNEALATDRHPDLLAWLITPARAVYFDEAHLGISEQAGVSGLIRKYNLEGGLIALLLLAGLYVWKSSVPFVPAPHVESADSSVMGRDSSAAFVNLLRRNIKPSEILRLCFDHWLQSLPRDHPHLNARAGKAREIVLQQEALPAHQRTPVRAYQEICRILKSRT